MLRWTLKDTTTDEVVALPYNPNTMSSPHAARNTVTTAVSPIDGQVRTMRPRRPVKDWTFGGIIRTEAHYTLLQTWVERGVPVELTDHLGRTFLLRLVHFRPKDRRPTPYVTWRLKYEMSATVLRRIS